MRPAPAFQLANFKLKIPLLEGVNANVTNAPFMASRFHTPLVTFTASVFAAALAKMLSTPVPPIALPDPFIVPALTPKANL